MLKPLFEADKAAKINRTRAEDEKVLVQPTDNQRGQDGLIPQLYDHAPTQAAFVSTTGSLLEKTEKEAALVTVLFKKEAFAGSVFLVSYMPLLVCHFVYSRKRNGRNTKE